MAHDVFVSYSNKDKPVADAVVAGLESKSIRCWIAPRDVTPGELYGDDIVKAIRLSRVMVVILSGNSNQSPQVKMEVERAIANEVVIIPFRIEEVQLTGAMELFLSGPHWLDALTPPLENQIEKLGRTIQLFLSDGDTSQLEELLTEPVSEPRPPAAIRRWRPGLLAAVLFAAVAVVAVVVVRFAVIRHWIDEVPSAVLVPPTATALLARPSATCTPTETWQPRDPSPTPEPAAPAPQATPTESAPSAPPSVGDSVCPERIGFGETIRCAIDSPAQMDTYTFAAEAGDEVLVRMSRESGDLRPGIRVYDADGAEVCQASGLSTAEIGNCTLEGGGEVSILTFDTGATRTGDYYLYLQRLSRPGRSEPIGFGQTLRGTITSPAQMDTYTFAAEAGDEVLVRISRESGDLRPGIRVYDADGAEVCQASDLSTAEIGSCTLEGGGEVSILTFDTGATRTGDYYL